MVSLVSTAVIKEFVKTAQAANLTVNLDKSAGTVSIKDGDTVVLNGIQKGRNGAWITRFTNTENVKWQ